MCKLRKKYEKAFDMKFVIYPVRYAIKYIKTIIYIRENITVTKVSFCRNILPNKIYDEFHIKSFFILLS